MDWFFSLFHAPIVPDSEGDGEHHLAVPKQRYLITYGTPKRGLAWVFTVDTAHMAMKEIAEAASRKECGLSYMDAVRLIRRVRATVYKVS